ncbi:UNVERIFIED_CONTAM: hypothetical protein GTU68_005403 [Idotea baltica]|nr:hypothetical protein [Idotea baltica]
MKRAGRAVFEAINYRWPGSPITVFCGAGNNGGDGYIVAALAAQNQLPVQLIQLAPMEKLTGDALTAYQYAQSAGVSMAPFTDCLELQMGVIVDALLGTGFVSVGASNSGAAIRLMNHSGLPVVAADIPSGLCSNTGTAADPTIEAVLTVSFIGLKQGLFTGRGPALCGEILYHDLSVTTAIFDNMQPSTMRMKRVELMAELPCRARDAHKGDSGHVMVIGGDIGFGGAAAMAAEAALRTGAGLVSVATQPEHVSAVLARRPELMVKGVSSGQELMPLLNGELASPSVLVVGPGLGRSSWSEQMLQQALASGLPILLDADALNILSEGRLKIPDHSKDWIITPHPGEAARLLGITTADIQKDRFAAVRALQKKFNCSALLKGAGSLVCTSEESPIDLCTSGNPGMAVGGMGDVLSGIVGGLMSQGIASDVALSLGVCLHAEAGDIAAKAGERGLLATDLFGPLHHLINEEVSE